jgi:hypothetical protein
MTSAPSGESGFRRTARLRVFSGLLILRSVNGFAAAAVDEQLSFARDIKPIFERACLRCHGAEKPKSGYRLDNRRDGLAGGDIGTAIIPGKANESPLIRYVTHAEPDLEMPPIGKGDPLSDAEVLLLRNWIDQGAAWEATSVVKATFSISPTIRNFWVSGNERRFREHSGFDDQTTAGVADFSWEKQYDSETRLSLSGHALPAEEDFQTDLTLETRDVGFIRLGGRKWRRFYDNRGSFHSGSAAPAPLDRELSLDLGRAWIDLGLTLPDWPEMVLGYEYRFKNGTKSSLAFGPSGGKGIAPSFREIGEELHILKFDLNHEWRGFEIEDQARFEIHNLDNRLGHGNTFVGSNTPETLRDTSDQLLGANSLRLDRQIKNWWFASGGYHYSRLKADAAVSLATAPPPAGIGFQWIANGVTHDAQTHAFGLSSLLGPFDGLTLSPSVQMEWNRRQSLGDADLQFVGVGLTAVPMTLRSSYDERITTEALTLRYTRLRNLVLHATGRLTQEAQGHFDQQAGAVGFDSFTTSNPPFLQDTDGEVDEKDFRIGARWTPHRVWSVNTHLRHRKEKTGYLNNELFIGSPIGAQLWSLPGFIRAREESVDEARARIVARLQRWWRANLTYQFTAGDYRTRTDAAPGAPGGDIFAANSDSHSLSLGNTFTPNHQLFLNTSVTLNDSRTVSAQNGRAEVAPWQGQSLSLFAAAQYHLNKRTELQTSYSFSQSEFAQANAAAGVPAGIDYSLHGWRSGILRRWGQGRSLNFQYAFYRYDEPTAGGINDYTAHGIFATLTLPWPQNLLARKHSTADRTRPEE